MAKNDNVYHNCTRNESDLSTVSQGNLLIGKEKINEVKRKTRKPCPYCGYKVVKERLRPDIVHHSELICDKCDRHIQWISKRESLFDQQGNRRKLTVKAIPREKRKGNAFCRVVDTLTGEIVADQLGIGESDYYFECREEVSENA